MGAPSSVRTSSRLRGTGQEPDLRTVGHRRGDKGVLHGAVLIGNVATTQLNLRHQERRTSLAYDHC